MSDNYFYRWYVNKEMLDDISSFTVFQIRNTKRCISIKWILYRGMWLNKTESFYDVTKIFSSLEYSVHVLCIRVFKPTCKTLNTFYGS